MFSFPFPFNSVSLKLHFGRNVQRPAHVLSPVLSLCASFTLDRSWRCFATCQGTCRCHFHVATAPNLAMTCNVDCPSGGHTTEIIRLMESLSAVYTPRHYVIADTDRMSEDKICTFEASRQSSKSQVHAYTVFLAKLCFV